MAIAPEKRSRLLGGFLFAALTRRHLLRVIVVAEKGHAHPGKVHFVDCAIADAYLRVRVRVEPVGRRVVLPSDDVGKERPAGSKAERRRVK